MDKKKYFVDFQTLEISPLDIKGNHGLEIYASEKERMHLQLTLEEMKSDDFVTFLRAMVPIKPYHEAQHNIKYTEEYSNALQQIYTLGTEETRKFIDESGLLSDKHVEKGESYPGRKDSSE